MNTTVRHRLADGQRRIRARLAREREVNPPRPVFRGRNLHYEIGARQRGLVYGGIGLFLELARQSGLVAAIDRRVQGLKWHLPYHESDHVLNLAFNALCDGRCLQDLELRRNDEAFLDALGADRIPDPTTAGDFCRRFRSEHLHSLNAAIDEARQNVWQRQPAEFFDRATLDFDGTLVETRGEKKQGVDIAYDGTWGYHPLVCTLAETGEVLRVINRPGNRPEIMSKVVDGELKKAVCLGRNWSWTTSHFFPRSTPPCQKLSRRRPICL
ncbi:MAG: transposase, partial [Planctomycetales bacterium]|nr:transposase [Planctomycetales bacterium]